MTENQGERPEDRTPEDPQAGAVWQPPAQPPLPTTPAADGYPPRPVPGPQDRAADAASQTPEAAPAQPTASSAPIDPGPTAQGVPPRPQPPYGQYAFGPAQGTPTGTQQTLPLGEAPVSQKRQKLGAGKVVGIMVAAAIVGGAAGLGGAYAGATLFSSTSETTVAGPSTVTVNDTDSVNQTTGIAAKVVPSVVTISANNGSTGGTGSGVVLSEDGYVVTNTHVVTLDGATADASISVTTSDGRVFSATIVGTDPIYDLAVIKLEGAEDLTPIDFASSADLNVGDTTVAVGAPLGLSNTVTTGIVSALNRSIQIASSAAPDTEQDETQDDGNDRTPPFYFDFGDEGQQPTATETISIAVIQTDAAINPGNSGGALVDDEGNLIGINVAIASAGSSSESGSIGVGFSIPSDVVQRITDEIIAEGSATHGLLGASVMPAASVEGATISGAYLADVSEGGAAAAVGLQIGDIVTGFNGVPITDATDLTAQVRAAAAGSAATVTFVRDGETRSVEVTLGELG
ncbi:trypsin-like peptidase domain-containing protein [Microbacterium sp. SSW1-59]|uniref:S1C family serine protease n=1 Tax=Microbacterium xanthum TaxID=3079794 RepID=UPI002AD3249B|nr:trypsin-like peptidase domain-containing protein [Microbacterium sp. SSW1-59]MDZ8202115.1 trypsin-like peptidase domain-containing protein [Microbacterium sp. SSW1-59]